MADPRVLEAQQWVNATYRAVPGYVPCAETGRTGWATMYSLTRGLQHELGITALSDSFGPTTLARLEQRGPIGPGFPNTNIVKIAQHGLFCKGYYAGDTTTGTYGIYTQNAVRELQTNAIGATGFNDITAKWFKAILNMDAYVLLSGGSAEIRTIQQWLNERYRNRSTFFIGPCDGHFSRDVQTALMKAIQYESGIPDAQATGSFGPATRDSLRRNTVGPGSPQIWVRLFSAACVFNGTVDNTSTVFKSGWDGALEQYVRAFQMFSALNPPYGRGDYPTWAQLLVSTGDPDRTATACDTSQRITLARAQALRAANFTVVGRYLENASASPDALDKQIKPGELADIFTGGLRVFPISQYDGRSIDNFTYSTGYLHGKRAHERAVGHGFNRGTVIYFAVDFDATDDQIDSNILPYFHGVQAALAEMGRRYVAGVYGSRNVCTRVTSQAYTRFSFVSGMSYGFSGNLGFPLPGNWSFNQIKEISFNANGDAFPLDRVVHRPFSDPGVGNVGDDYSTIEVFLRYIDDLYETAVAYGVGDPNLRVMEFLRYPTYVDLYTGFQLLMGDVDRAWIAWAEDNGPSRLPTFRDPQFGVTINADHLGATANGEFLVGGGFSDVPTRGDFSGWGGDLATFYGEWRNNADSYASGYAFCRDRLAKVDVASSFPLSDLIEDADGHFVGSQLRLYGGRINDVLRSRLTNGTTGRFIRFHGRFGGDPGRTVTVARNMLTSNYDDEDLALLCAAAIRSTGGWNCLMPADMPADKLDPFLEGWAETLRLLAEG
ncbi:glycoside hydrolase domain-containing protein [Actinoplanes sp. CA-252034]|uniref:glycoside hydrolase domain-containing protein n=1 Tax=Actinoplanes sp. CA-252034 TaxID=3239906 RepID=UPI003D96DDE7